VDEGVVARLTVRLPGYQHEERDPGEEDTLDLKDILVIDTVIGASLSLKNQMDDSITTQENISSCQEKSPNGLPDKLNDEETCQPHVRLPRVNSFRPHRIEKDDFSARIPQAPIIISKQDWIDVDEGVAARSAVRFPGRRNEEDLSARQELDEPLLNDLNEDTEETEKKLSYSCLLLVDPVEKTCLAETAWNEELGDCRNEPHDFQISVDNGIDYEDRNNNGIFDSKQNGPKDVTQEESQIMDLNIPSIELTDIPGDAPDDKSSQLDVQTGIVDDPYSFIFPLFVECAYDLEVCSPFGSTTEKDMRVHLMDGIGCQLVDPPTNLLSPRLVLAE
jgi:hypothetical protein